MLGPEGRITARGNFDSLKSACDYVRELQASQKTIDPASSESSQEVVISVENGGQSDSGGPDKVIAKAVSKKKAAEGVEEAEEEEVEKSRPVSNFWYYVSSMGRGPVWVFAALVVFRAACDTAQRMYCLAFPRPCLLVLVIC